MTPPHGDHCATPSSDQHGFSLQSPLPSHLPGAPLAAGLVAGHHLPRTGRHRAVKLWPGQMAQGHTEGFRFLKSHFLLCACRGQLTRMWQVEDQKLSEFWPRGSWVMVSRTF